MGSAIGFIIIIMVPIIIYFAGYTHGRKAERKQKQIEREEAIKWIKRAIHREH